jgi:TRAP-type mannitol/chloroaromatic compound transport system permease large subunit
MGLASIATIVFTQPIPLSIVVQRMGTGLDSFVLIAIPLFVLAGHLLNRAGIADRIFEFAAALVGHIRGGLAHVNVVASMIFAGMSGVAQADAAGLGVVEVNAMRKEGFDPGLRRGRERGLGHHRPDHPALGDHGGVRRAGAGLGGRPVPGRIPARHPDGWRADGDDLLAGQHRRVVAPPTQPMSYPRLGRTFVRALPALAAPILLTVGLLAGVATPTELGALTVVYAAASGSCSAS